MEVLNSEKMSDRSKASIGNDSSFHEPEKRRYMDKSVSLESRLPHRETVRSLSYDRRV